MKAIVCEQWGDPEKVLQVRDVPAPVCGPGQVRVRMLASPINPSDLFMVRASTANSRRLPVHAGLRGRRRRRGRAMACSAWRVKGKRVAVLNGGSGNWAEQVVIPARQAVPVPDDLSDEQAATFFVNPASAIVMTRNILQDSRTGPGCCRPPPAAPWAAWSSAWASSTASAPSTSSAARSRPTS